MTNKLIGIINQNMSPEHISTMKRKGKKPWKTFTKPYMWAGDLERYKS